MNSTDLSLSSPNNIVIIGEHTLAPGSLKYWLDRRRQLMVSGNRGDVSVIDPRRHTLSQLRSCFPEIKGRKVLRASTGGKWGKSVDIVTV